MIAKFAFLWQRQTGRLSVKRLLDLHRLNRAKLQKRSLDLHRLIRAKLQKGSLDLHRLIRAKLLFPYSTVAVFPCNATFQPMGNLSY